MEAYTHRACVCAPRLSPCHVEAHLDAFISRSVGVEARIHAHRLGARRDQNRSAKAAMRSSQRRKAPSWRIWESSYRAPRRWGRARAPPRRAAQHRQDASATAVRSSPRRSRPRAASPGGSSVERGHREGRRGLAGPGGAGEIDATRARRRIISLHQKSSRLRLFHGSHGEPVPATTCSRERQRAASAPIDQSAHLSKSPSDPVGLSSHPPGPSARAAILGHRTHDLTRLVTHAAGGCDENRALDGARAR